MVLGVHMMPCPWFLCRRGAIEEMEHLHVKDVVGKAVAQE